MRRTVALVILVGLAIGLAIVLATLSGFLVDWLWFDTLGFGAVFSTVWHAQVGAFAVATVASALVLSINGLVAAWGPARRVRRLRLIRRDGLGFEESPDFFELSPQALPWRAIVPAIALLLG